MPLGYLALTAPWSRNVNYAVCPFFYMQYLSLGKGECLILCFSEKAKGI